MILYFGNILSVTGNNPSFIEILGPRLATMTEVRMASDRKNQVTRLLQMVSIFLRYRAKASFVLIDTYSYLGFYYAVVLAVLAKITGTRYIPIVRGGDFKRRFSIRPRLTHWFLRSAHAIVVPSPYLLAVFKEQGYEAEYIPNFIDSPDYRFQQRHEVQPRLLWVRSFHSIYNPELAIKVIRMLADEYPAARLCMVGPDKDGSMERCKKIAMEAGIDHRIVFTGKLSKSDWALRSADYDIFINTATIDNHPVSVMEAMLLGLPVVSTRVGGIPDLVEDGKEGILVPSNDPAAFVAAIKDLVASPGKAEQLQKQARQKAESFDWISVRDKWINLLRLEHGTL